MKDTESNPSLADLPQSKPSFSDLISDHDLVAAMKALNIIEPSEVQAAAIPEALKGKDLIVQAQTGSGKTLAFMLPIIMALRQENKKSGTYAIILTPTRELALQVKKVVASISPDITPACIIGGASAHGQLAELKSDPRIIVGTPGRLLDMIERKNVILRSCKMFVLDEADEMLSMGFVEEVRTILRKLPKERQGLLFSATITDRVASLASSFLKDPETIVIAKLPENEPDIEHMFCWVDGGVAGKASALCRLLEQEGAQSAIVFCNTKSDTEIVEIFLKRRGYNALRINSDLSQKERDAVLEQLRNGSLQYLIATDVAARGIDIKQLELVVNYSLHDQPEVYVHRSGRTGRAGASGRAVSLIAPRDFAAFTTLKRHVKVDFKEITIPDEPGVQAQNK